MLIRRIARFVVVMLICAAPTTIRAADAEDATAANVVIPAKRQELHTKVLAAIEKMKGEEGIKPYFEKAYGYAVFPSVAKGGLVVGAARGEGEVFEQGKVVGFSVLEQGSIGLQIGGQAYSEVVFFENKEALDHFKEGNAEFAGQASGVAGGAGGGENVKYTDGIAVFVFSQKGLMGEASIGGQGFDYEAYELKAKPPEAAPASETAAPAAPAPAPAAAAPATDTPAAAAAPAAAPAPAAEAAPAAVQPAADASAPIAIEGPDTKLHKKVLKAIEHFRKSDPRMDRYLRESHAYAVYPEIAKGGFVVGAARGDGEVVEQGKVIGTSVLSQGSIGLQIGGQEYSEVIFFQTKEALEDFKEGDAEFAGQASGVAGGADAGENVHYENGVAVFTFSAKGLMGEASIGGQGFSFKPLE